MAFIDLNRRKGNLTLGFMPVLAFFLFPSIGGAWSYEGYSASINYDVSRETSLSTAPPTSAYSVANMCKSLLQSDQYSSPNSATDSSQRKAGKLAALGIILGARFAVAPSQASLNKHGAQANASARSARSIAAFRKCQKDYILSVAAI